MRTVARLLRRRAEPADDCERWRVAVRDRARLFEAQTDAPKRAWALAISELRTRRPKGCAGPVP